MLAKFLKKALSVTLTLIMVLSSAAALGSVMAFADAELNNQYDFSEMNMVTNTSYLAPDSLDGELDGGDIGRIGAYLTSWDGAVAEAADPYDVSDITYKECDSVLHIDEIVYIEPTVSAVKQAVMQYGALFAQYLSGASHYGEDYINYYCPPNGDYDSGHAVCIVGWDDNYSKRNFNTTPKANGAFICKNSWGTNVCEDGFIYISYYDDTFVNDDFSAIVAYVAQTGEQSANKIYQYDPLGVNGVVDKLYDRIDYVANVFPEQGQSLSSNEALKAVSFYTYGDNIKYDVYVIDNFTTKEDMDSRISAGDCLYKTSGTMEQAGYHTLDVSGSITLEAGSRFAVAVRLTDSFGRAADYACENPIGNYCENARANIGESFYKASSMIFDVNVERDNMNWCVKAFTQCTVPGSRSQGVFSGIINGVDNANRKYSSDAVYTVNELSESGIKLNKAFVDWVNGEYGDISGALPSPVSASHSGSKPEAALPAKYDLRDFGLVSPVRNQFSLGSCWAFAACAALESNALKQDAQNDFDGAHALATNTDYTAEITAGASEYISFTATEDGEYTFTANSDFVAFAEFGSNYGVEYTTKVGADISHVRNMGAGETVIIRVGFANASQAGSITVKASADGALLNPVGVRRLTVGDSCTGTTSSEYYDSFILTADDAGDAFFVIECDAPVTMYVNKEYIEQPTVVDGRVINLLWLNARGTSIEIRSITPGANYTLKVLTMGSDVAEYAAVLADGGSYDLNSYEDSVVKVVSFTPAQDGWYAPVVACDDYYPTAWVFNADGTRVDYCGENWDRGYYRMTGGETYYLFYDHGGYGCINEQADLRMDRMSEVNSITPMTLNKYAADIFPDVDGEVVFSFTAAESGQYRFFVKNSDYADTVFTDDDGVACGTVAHFLFDTYIFDDIEAGETRFVKISIADDYEFDDAFFGVGISIIAQRCDEGASLEDMILADCVLNTGYEVSLEDTIGFSFTPETDGDYVVTTKGVQFAFVLLNDNGMIDDFGSYIYAIDHTVSRSRYTLEGGKTYTFGVMNYGEDDDYSIFIETVEHYKASFSTAITSGVKATGVVFGEDGEQSMTYADAELMDRDAFSLQVVIACPIPGSEIEVSSYIGEIFLEDEEYVEETQLWSSRYSVSVFEDTDSAFTIKLMDDEDLRSFEFEITVNTYEKYIYIYTDEVNLCVNTSSTIEYQSYYKVDELLWTTSNSSVATVTQSGEISAVGVGAAKITLESKDGDAKRVITVYVTPPKVSFFQRLIAFFKNLFSIFRNSAII